MGHGAPSPVWGKAGNGAVQDYYPGGMLMPGRSFNSDEYRFGFQGQEKDDEINGTTGSHYTAQFWEYDSRICRRWNLDPKPTIGISEYACFKDNPIWFNDILGDTTDFYDKNDKFLFQINDDWLCSRIKGNCYL